MTEDKCRLLEEVPELKKKAILPEKAKRKSELMKLLSHPTRLQILDLLSRKDLCVCVLAEVLDKPQPNVSQHLGKLKASNVVESYPEGKYVYYRLKEPKIEKLLNIDF